MKPGIQTPLVVVFASLLQGRDQVGCSVTTVSRGNRQLRYGGGGFESAFDTLVELGHPDPRSS